MADAAAADCGRIRRGLVKIGAHHRLLARLIITGGAVILKIAVKNRQVAAADDINSPAVGESGGTDQPQRRARRQFLPGFLRRIINMGVVDQLQHPRRVLLQTAEDIELAVQRGDHRLTARPAGEGRQGLPRRLRCLQVKGKKGVFSAAEADISGVANQRTTAVGKCDRQIGIRFARRRECQHGQERSG